MRCPSGAQSPCSRMSRHWMSASRVPSGSCRPSQPSPWQQPPLRPWPPPIRSCAPHSTTPTTPQWGRNTTTAATSMIYPRGGLCQLSQLWVTSTPTATSRWHCWMDKGLPGKAESTALRRLTPTTPCSPCCQEKPASPVLSGNNKWTQCRLQEDQTGSQMTRTKSWSWNQEVVLF